MKVSLIIERGPSKGREIQLKRQTTLLGKSEQCDVRIASRITSRRHCEISVEKDFVVLRDLNSRNGTFLNGDRVNGEVFLSNGDKIIVGDALFSVRITEDERTSTHAEIVKLAKSMEGPPADRVLSSTAQDTTPEAPTAEETAPESPEPVAAVPVEEEPVQAVPAEDVAPAALKVVPEEEQPAMVEEVITAENKPSPRAFDTSLYEQVIEGLVAAGESMSVHYLRTSRKVRNVMALLTRVLEIGKEEERMMKLAAMLYEVGKYYLATDLLNKGEALTPEERKKLEQHPQLTIRLFEKVPLPAGVKEAIAHHHERYDGTGYPDGLKGEQIPAGARMLAIADAMAAMTSSRPYRPALSTPQALDEMEKNAGTQFDPVMVSKFVDHCRLHQNELREAVNLT